MALGRRAATCTWFPGQAKPYRLEVRGDHSFQEGQLRSSFRHQTGFPSSTYQTIRAYKITHSSYTVQNIWHVAENIWSGWIPQAKA